MTDKIIKMLIETLKEEQTGYIEVGPMELVELLDGYLAFKFIQKHDHLFIFVNDKFIENLQKTREHWKEFEK